MTPPKLPLVVVEWLDHITRSGWQDHKDTAKLEPATIFTIGWVVNETDTVLTIAGAVDVSADADDNFNNIFLIIKGCIVSRKEIDEKGQLVLG